MFFYSLHTAAGEVLFSNDKFHLLRITSSAASNVSLNNIRALPPCNSHALDKFFAPRFPHILFISKDQYRLYLDNDDVQDLDTEAVMSGSPEFAQLVMTIKSLKGKSDNLDIRRFFTAGHLGADDLIYWSDDIEPDGVKYVLSLTGNHFKLEDRGSPKVVKGVYFANEFETIYVPLDNPGLFETMWTKVQARSALDGRISNHYLVVPTSHEHRRKVGIQGLRHMKTEEMLEFFAHHRKGGTKVETLSGCLESLTRRFVKNLDQDVGKTCVVQVSTYQVRESPLEIMPVDWILCRAAHMRIKYAEALDNQHQDMFVEICKEPVDDFAQVLYTTFEQAKRTIYFGFFDPEKLESIWRVVREACKPVTVNEPVNS